MGTDTPEQGYLRRASVLAGQDKDAADAIGMSAAHFSRMLGGKVKSHLNVRTCFRLARYIGEPPQAVLRAAHKADIAAAIEEHYGTAIRQVPVEAVDPLLRGLAGALDRPAFDRVEAWMLVNMIRKRAGLPAMQSAPADRRARRQ